MQRFVPKKREAVSPAVGAAAAAATVSNGSAAASAGAVSDTSVSSTSETAQKRKGRKNDENAAQRAAALSGADKPIAGSAPATPLKDAPSKAIDGGAKKSGANRRPHVDLVVEESKTPAATEPASSPLHANASAVAHSSTVLRDRSISVASTSSSTGGKRDSTLNVTAASFTSGSKAHVLTSPPLAATSPTASMEVPASPFVQLVASDLFTSFEPLLQSMAGWTGRFLVTCLEVMTAFSRCFAL